MRLAPLALTLTSLLPLGRSSLFAQAAQVQVSHHQQGTHFSAMSSAKDNLELEGTAKQRVEDAMALFQARPSLEILKRSWAPDAIFEDPICYAQGFREFAAQWYGMPAAFSKSDTLAWRVTKNEPDEIIYVQKQLYTVKGIGFQKEMTSTVVMRLDGQGKIKHFEDRWDHKEMPSSSLVYALRRLNAVTMPYLIGVPKEGQGLENGNGHANAKKEL